MDKRLRLIGVLTLLALSLAAAATTPVYAVCDPVCTANCNADFEDCIDQCGGQSSPGNPCSTECRNLRIACYQVCC
ncbi:MAG TPA: hypothetical protein VF756_15010 [Thermoanaerobaculia bacterium]